MVNLFNSWGSFSQGPDRLQQRVHDDHHRVRSTHSSCGVRAEHGEDVVTSSSGRLYLPDLASVPVKVSLWLADNLTAAPTQATTRDGNDQRVSHVAVPFFVKAARKNEVMSFMAGLLMVTEW